MTVAELLGVRATLYCDDSFKRIHPIKNPQAESPTMRRATGRRTAQTRLGKKLWKGESIGRKG